MIIHPMARSVRPTECERDVHGRDLERRMDGALPNSLRPDPSFIVPFLLHFSDPLPAAPCALATINFIVGAERGKDEGRLGMGMGPPKWVSKVAEEGKGERKIA